MADATKSTQPPPYKFLVQEVQGRLDLILERAAQSHWPESKHLARLREIASGLNFTAPEAFGQEHVNRICEVLSLIKPSLSLDDANYVGQLIKAPFSEKLK